MGLRWLVKDALVCIQLPSGEGDLNAHNLKMDFISRATFWPDNELNIFVILGPRAKYQPAWHPRITGSCHLPSAGAKIGVAHTLCKADRKHQGHH